MRVDHRAAAKSNLHARVNDNPGRLRLSKVEIRKRQRVQTLLGHVRRGCMACCKTAYLSGNGNTLECALRHGRVPDLTPEEAATAATCRLPQFYADISAGKLADLTFLQVLEAVPFAVPEALLETARYEAEDAAALAATAEGGDAAQAAPPAAPPAPAAPARQAPVSTAGPAKGKNGE